MNHVELREEVHARLAAWVQPTFRHDGDPDPHPDEAALVDRLTDGVVLPCELKLREALAEVEKLRARTREEIERRSYAVTHAKICEEKCDEALAEVEQLRAGRIPLMTLRQAWRNGWTDRGTAIRQTVADADRQRDAYERAFARYMSEEPAEDDKDPYRPVDGPDDPAFEQQAGQGGAR